MTVKPRGVCPFCLRKVPLRQDGTVQAHNPPPDPTVRPRYCGGSYGTRPGQAGIPVHEENEVQF